MNATSTRAVTETASIENVMELLKLANAHRVSQAIYVAAKLGIADLLKDGPRGSAELAQPTGAHQPSLYRLLRFLTGVGLFVEVEPDRFGLTPLGAGLRTDGPVSAAPLTVMLLDETLWRSWGELLHSVETGETAFDHIYGMTYFEFLERHPETAELFNRSMTSVSQLSPTPITDVYDFSGIQRLVDVGGGHGKLIATILQTHPAMEGVLFDQPGVAEGASATLDAAGVADRCEIVGGDFFTSVPPNGDAYILRMIIHDWDDAQSTAILKNCRQAMRESGKLLMIEQRIADDYREALTTLGTDVLMLVCQQGRERTDAEYRALFADAGLRLTNILSLGDSATYSIFEGAPN